MAEPLPMIIMRRGPLPVKNGKNDSEKPMGMYFDRTNSIVFWLFP